MADGGPAGLTLTNWDLGSLVTATCWCRWPRPGSRRGVRRDAGRGWFGQPVALVQP